METIDYCQEIERYLCRKNDGHLIRVVGPSFELVAGWATRGVPLKVAFRGIDRYFERYYAKGPRRRPVKIDFCEADVLDVFDDWRRALGVPSGTAQLPRNGAAGNRGAGTDASAPASVNAESNTSADIGQPERPRDSLPAHLQRAVMRLSSARASGAITEAFDPIIDRIAAELDAVRSHSGGIRGEARRALIERLAALDRELAEAGVRELETAALDDCRRQAEEDLHAFRATMAPEAFVRARDTAVDRLVRERLGLPVVAYL